MKMHGTMNRPDDLEKEQLIFSFFSASKTDQSYTDQALAMS